MDAAPRLYSHEDVVRFLEPDACIAAVREAMRNLTAGAFEQPLRSIVTLAPGRLFAQMPGVGHDELGFGAKLVSVYADPSRPSQSRHQGIVVVFDRASGAVRCLAEAGAITEIRTGCASAVATDALAREDARVLAIFGTGAQARSHAIAVTRVRPFERLVLWGRDPSRLEALKAGLEPRLGLGITTTTDGREAAQAADVICTTTAATTPILLREWVRPGTHLNIVGSSLLGPAEIDSALVRDSRYIADYRRSALAAASEFAIAKQAGLVTDAHIVAEIGEVLLGRVAGRRHRDEITLYKSLGHIVQDLAAADCVHRAATAAGQRGSP